MKKNKEMTLERTGIMKDSLECLLKILAERIGNAKPDRESKKLMQDVSLGQYH